MIINQTPYPISFEMEISQALTCRYGEEMRQYIFKPDINVSGLSCLLQIAKPDGTFTENGVEVRTDPDTGECTLVLTIPTQATVVKGLAHYSICCYGEVETETHLLYSAEGPLWVDDDLITEEMIQSVAEVNGYTFPQDFFTVDMIPEIVNQIISDILDDDTTSETTTWSSTKIQNEIDQIDIAVSETSTGNPIEFTDGADAPLVKCTTAIQGNQDLHGYDKPWVGGAGKNKFDPESTSDLWVLQDGTQTHNPKAKTVTRHVSAGENVTLSNKNNSSSSNILLLVFYDSSDNLLLRLPMVTGAKYVSGTAPENTSYVLASFYTWSLSDEQQLEIGVSHPTAYTPYSNICPITAYNQSTISVEDENEVVQQTSTATFSNSIYQGNVDFVGGKATTTWGYIASYAGDTLPGEWISDRDEYAPGTTPTIGAQVAYALATPTTTSVTPTNLPIKSLFGYNHIESSTGEMEVEYIIQTYEPIAELIDRSSLHVYSTEEHVVGKWIDDKTLYEKTYSTVLSGNSATISIADLNADKAWLYDGFYDIGVTMLPLNEFISTSAFVRTHVNPGSGYQNIDCLNNVSANSTVYVTIRYTKTS